MGRTFADAISGTGSPPQIPVMIKEILLRLKLLHLDVDVHTAGSKVYSFPITDVRRLQHLVLGATNSHLPSSFTLFDEHCLFGKLETLELHRYVFPERNAYIVRASPRKLIRFSTCINQDFVNAITVMSRLEHLHFSGAYISQTAMLISSSSLTRLELNILDHTLGSYTDLSALSSLPKLTHLALITGGGRIGIRPDTPSSFHTNSPPLPCLTTISIRAYPGFFYSPLMSLGPLILRAPGLASFELCDSDAMEAVRTLIESDERFAPNLSYQNLHLIRVVFSIPRLYRRDERRLRDNPGTKT